MKDNRHIHFIGIGGIGMSGIAWLCIKRGFKVTGSDVKPSRITEKLANNGAQIFIGHKKENLQDPDIVVYSSAITFQNPELDTAVKKSIPAWQRGNFLNELMKSKKCIAVSGSHGKTTTSSLITTILHELDYKPTGVIGAIVENLSGNALSGDGDYFVVEADESDGTLLALDADYALITNIDAEHMDFYNDMDQLLKVYLQFAKKPTPDGAFVCCGDDKRIQKLLPEIDGRTLTYGLGLDNNLRAKDITFSDATSQFSCIYDGKELGKININIPGEHNVLNALGAMLVCLDLGIEFKDIATAIEKFFGAQRRFEKRGEVNGILVIDDYAHHPTEIAATLKSAKNLNRRRVIGVFQPHRFTRTKLLYKDFAASFADADTMILTDIYPASEPPLYGVTSKLIYDESVKMRNTNIIYLPQKNIINYLKTFARRGDLLVILGAGDINRLADKFLAEVKIKDEKAQYTTR